MEYFEELLKKPSLFLDESKLDMNYVPEKLPHRDKELSLLSQLFLTLITNPNSISRKILITGKTGIGKTVTVKIFGEILKEASTKRNICIEYVHVNCRKERTSYRVLIKIIRLINKKFPKRGYSPQDLLENLIDFLNKHNIHILIVLDELSYLINKGEDLIYLLTRINDDSTNVQQRVSIIGIVRDLSCLNNLDYSTISTLQRNIIKFSNYSKKQIFDILKYRAHLSLKENVISKDLIKMIVESTYSNGDIRYGLNILWKAAKIAESRNLTFINNECVRLGSQELVPFSTLDVLKYMPSQKLIFLLATVKGLKISNMTEISFLEIRKSYQIICENMGLNPRSNSQLWNYLQEFKRESIVLINTLSEKIKGRRSLIQIPEINLPKLEKIIIEILELKGISI
ncbi:MAG: AAA family ATPase [Candidatus Lokiarchaeota archaeon]|nr:AAA family ATPase [Candidatus Lokiarchaeota archaeon]